MWGLRNGEKEVLDNENKEVCVYVVKKFLLCLVILNWTSSAVYSLYILSDESGNMIRIKMQKYCLFMVQ